MLRIKHSIIIILSSWAILFQTCTTVDPVVALRLKTLEQVMNGVDIRFRSTALKLIERGVDTSYISKILHYSGTSFLENMVKINVSGFVKKADYSHNFNEKSVKSAREFFTSNADELKRAEDSSGVPAEVITSILWVETKFGTITGKNHVVSVYASLATADELNNIEMNKQTYRASIADKDSLARLDSMVDVRARKKATWAVDQLIALKEMQAKYKGDVMELRGSWAGAFGWSQFIPSSYNSWAVDGNGDGSVNLFDKQDAIASVANYLKVNGWGNERAQQEAAVYHYNNSKDYVDCVLTLAQKIKEKL